MKFILHGIPISKMRPRAAVIQGNVMMYSKQKQEENLTKVLLRSMISQTNQSELTEMAIADSFDIEMTFYLPYPKKLRKREIKAIADGSLILHANSKPDIDNLIKFYLDAANEILYSDDKQIISIKAKKCYDEIPRTEFFIKPHGLN